MKEQTLINEFGNLWKMVQGLGQQVQISVLSQSVRETALTNLLVKKGLFTKEELEEEVRAEAQVLVAEAEKANQKPESVIVPVPAASKLILPS